MIFLPILIPLIGIIVQLLCSIKFRVILVWGMDLRGAVWHPVTVIYLPVLSTMYLEFSQKGTRF